MKTATQRIISKRGANIALIGLLTVLVASACSRKGEDARNHDREQPGAVSKLTNRIELSKAVRDNLGVTFARVERRRVAKTLRLPGAFEAGPFAREAYHAALAGEIELIAREYSRVNAGDPLFRLRSPGWREAQRELGERFAAADKAAAQAASLEAKLEAARRGVELARQRVEGFAALLDAQHARLAGARRVLDVRRARIDELERLQAAGGGKASELAEARAQFAEAEAALAERQGELTRVGFERREAEMNAEVLNAALSPLEAEMKAARVEASAARTGATLMLATAAALTGHTSEKLAESEQPGARPRWAALDVIEYRARHAGVVESIVVSQGAWVEAGALVVSLLEPTAIRFRAHAPQGHMTVVREGMTATIVPAAPGTETPLRGAVILTPVVESDSRNFEVLCVAAESQPWTLPAWARPGAAAFLEIELDATAQVEFAIPNAAIARDGLKSVFFLRDRDNPDLVIRNDDGDLGLSDGRWTVVKSGMRPDDEVVLEGVYELMLTGQGALPPGAHVHSDGTVHMGPDE